MNKNFLQTKRLVLRPVKKGDEFYFLKYLNNKKIYRCLDTLPHPYTKKHANDWIKLNYKYNRKKKKTDVVFAVDFNGELIGSTGLHAISGHKCVLGYWIAEPYWGKGFATEAVQAVVKYGFKRLGLKRISACTYLFNKRSVRVLKKCGFNKEGHLRKAILKDRHLRDVYLFSKVV